ncbi:NupC/NupG family nucleoside CNT transporter [Thiorhodococcus mannitoliphagus]|uniref:NupC/NupG family nucleoside CNT transporter n=1 Tax=Thiorhodococcus mannitoliphagus TaxID=329406 RepID=UPI00197D8DED|nr:nucleoside transporter C-terminal domain-containing protein [Thiorhodococcus mannitoliphagus]
MTSLQPLLGLGVLIVLAWLLSENRHAVRPRLILAGLALQLVLALVLLKLPPVQDAFLVLNRMVLALQEATQAGTELVFGYLGGGSTPFETSYPQNSFVLAFQALPLILVISALSALLFYWRILPLLVRGFAWLLKRTLGTGGPLGLGAAANVFVGMTEAPLLIRPYLASMSRSALFGLMTCGMATIAGTVMFLYANFLSGVVPDAIGHILSASLISAPAALMLAGLLVPEETQVQEHREVRIDSQASSAMDAVTRGTLDAIPLWLNIMAMLIVMVALVSLANQLLGLLPAIGGEAVSAQRLLGWIMAPVVWLIGIPWSEASTAGALMGVKTVLNELIAYLELAGLPDGALSERSRLIMTYALCGFANLGSLGIMIGGLTTMAPARRDEIVGLGMKSILAGTMATLMTGAVVALLI